MLDKGKPPIYRGIFTEEGYGSMPARGRCQNTLERLGGKQIPRCARDDKGQIRGVGTMYRAPTQRESTGLKTRHDKGGKKDGALKGRRYEDKCEEWARCIVPLHGRGEGVPMRILLRRIREA